MRLIVSGTRVEGAVRQSRVDEYLDLYLLQYGAELVIVEGCATGVDSLAWNWAKRHKVPTLHYPAPWTHLGKPAGRWRNRAMLRICKADEVICFHPDIQNSHGTKDMAEVATDAGLPVTLVGSTMPL